MKINSNIMKRYIEAIIYSIVLVICIWLCISSNILIKMIPIAFIMGVLGQILFGKKFMTSFFSLMLSVVLLQIKTPANLLQNVAMSIYIAICSVIGEVCGIFIKKAIKLIKKKSKKSKKNKIKYIIFSIITLIVGIFLNSIVNGNYISYFNEKNKLQNYFIDEYSSSSRFKIVSSRYYFYPNMRYVFYTNDTLNNNQLGKFSVYVKDSSIVDDYKEQILMQISNEIKNNISTIPSIEGTNINVLYDDTRTLTIGFDKSIDSINRDEIEKYAKDVANYLESIKSIEYYDKIEQIRIVLQSKNNAKDSLASYIYMSGYNEMLKAGEEEPYEYIMRALNVEYFD